MFFVLFFKISPNSPKNSPKTRRDLTPPKTLIQKGSRYFFSQFGTRHYMGGRSSPPDFRFFRRKNHPIFSTQEIKKDPIGPSS